MRENENQHSQDEPYPGWEPTQWTPRQRTVALRSFLMLMFAYGFLAATLAIWGTAPLAQNTLIPIGMIVVCLGTALLTSVFWYSYRHGHNSVGEHATTGSGIYGMLIFEAFVSLVTLALQLVGAAFVATVGWSGWQDYSPYSYMAPAGLCLIFNFMMTVGQGGLNWRPTRDPAAPGSVLGSPVTGARLALRWLTMGLAQTSWLLIACPLLLLNSFWDTHTPTPVASMGFAIMAAFFLVVAIAEATNRTNHTNQPHTNQMKHPSATPPTPAAH